MQLDTNIPLRGQDQPGIIEKFGQAMSLADLMDKRQMSRIAMEQAPAVAEAAAVKSGLENQQLQATLQKTQGEIAAQPIEQQTKQNTLTDWATTHQKDLFELGHKQAVVFGNIMGDIDLNKEDWKEKYASRIPIARSIGIGADLMPDVENANIDSIIAAKNLAFTEKEKADAAFRTQKLEADKPLMKAQTAKAEAEARKAQQEANAGSIGGLSKEQENDIQKIIQDTNPLAAGRNALGIAGKSISYLNKAESTLSKDMVTNDDAKRAISAIDAAYASAGGSEVDPTVYGRIKGWMQMVAGKPTNIMPKAMKQELLDQIKDIRSVNEQTLVDNFATGEARLGDLINNPKVAERWNKHKNQYLKTIGSGVTKSGKKFTIVQ
jgi:hypothetical protein